MIFFSCNTRLRAVGLEKNCFLTIYKRPTEKGAISRGFVFRTPVNSLRVGA